MSEIDWEERHQAAERVLLPAFERAIQRTDYGFCAYGDAPRAIGGGDPFFYWFESKEAMLEALRDCAAFLYLFPSDMDLGIAQGNVEKAIGEARGFEELRVELNDYLSGDIQFTWIGSFDELCGSENEAAGELRGQFREDRDVSSDRGLIKPDEMTAFIEFINNYGV